MTIRVEPSSCVILDATWLRRNGVFDIEECRGTLKFGIGIDLWFSCQTNKLVVGDVVINLLNSDPNFGGTRYWFQCPRCEARSGRLYAKVGSTDFACHRCMPIRYPRTGKNLEPVDLSRNDRPQFDLSFRTVK